MQDIMHDGRDGSAVRTSRSERMGRQAQSGVAEAGSADGDETMSGLPKSRSSFRNQGQRRGDGGALAFEYL
jgi:hypothetical protein